MLQRAVESVLKMLHKRTAALCAERHSYHVDPHLAVLETVAANVGGGKLCDPPLLLHTHGLSRMAVRRVAPRTHLDENHRATVEGHQVDVSAEHAFTPAYDAIAETAEVFLGLRFAAAAQGIPRVRRIA